MIINITKRDGRLEPFNLDKVHRVLEWATEGISNVSISEIELKANIQLYDGIPAYDIHELLIKSAAELISDNTPNYQYVAARLVNYKLRKEVYGQYQPWPLLDIIKKNIDRGVYDPEILDKYTPEEINQIDNFVKHERDDTFTYVGMEQFRGKYLVQDRSTKTPYETPQVLYVMIAATLFSNYPQHGEKTRLQWVKEYYDAVSQFYISLPTPIMAGVRTPTRQFSSCVLIESGDSLDSINATSTSIVRYISKKAGIGIGVGAIRAIGSRIGDGSVVHTGLVPFLKYFQAAVKSCSQGGVRGGAATVYIPVWHLEFEDLIVLKNNKGTEESRVRHMDYAFQFNKTMYERLLSGGNITLFSPHDVPGLLDAFYVDQVKFKKLYEKYEADPTIRKKVLPAIDVFTTFINERKDTGRIYLMNVDHANEHGSFIPELAPIRQSNLCLTGDTIVDVKVDNHHMKQRLDKVPEILEKFDNVEVLSLNLESGSREYKKITRAAFMSRNATIIEIEDQLTGKKIRCTPDHQIYTKNRGYVLASDLTESDELDIRDTPAEISTEEEITSSIKITYLKQTADVYDITVLDNHNFYANDILVHNCTEIDLPTKPLNDANDESAEISLCTLSAINWGLVNNPSEFEKYCTLAVRSLDELLDYQAYPVPAAEKSTMNRRPLGIGIINLAYFLAKRGLKYNADALKTVDEYAEAWSYYLIKASADLAKEKGTIPLNHETKYGHGIVPVDTYKKDVDDLVPHQERCDWKGLRDQLKETGIRNSTLMALMPAETSAQISNSTNGIEPPRALVSYKQSKDGVMAQVVPGYHHLKNKYDLLWDQVTPEGYLKICAVLQKYIDQGISVNTSYNPEHFEDGKVPMSQLIKDIVTFYKYGGKQLYYNNTNDLAGEIKDDKPDEESDGFFESIPDDDADSCDSCVI